MPNARNLAILTAAVLVASCESPVSPYIGDDGSGEIVVEFGNRPDRWPLDPYVIDAARIDADTLVLRIDHGGCRRHAFALVAWDGWLESIPVQVHVVLAHEDRDDPCDALLRSHLKFDLSPLRAAFTAAYRGESGSMLIRLSNPIAPGGPPLHTLLYDF
jgi:hypothetical protein